MVWFVPDFYAGQVAASQRLTGLRMSLHIVQIIDNLIIGGAQKLLVTLAGQAQANGLELTIVSLSSDNDRLILDELAGLATTVVIFPAQHLLDLRRILRLIRFLSGGNFDLVQCHLTYANIIGALCGRLAGLPVVTTLHSIKVVLQEFHPFIGALETWTIRYLSNRVVAVGYTIAASFRGRLRAKSIDVIPNAVPIPARITEEERLELRKEIAGDAHKKIVISVGRIAPPKGYEDLVAAFSILASSHPDILLILVGDGPLFGNIRDLVVKQSLEKNVLLLGAREDVPRLLAASDLYVSSSHWEGLPLAILEAMMAGLPVVATNVGDIPRLVTADIGLLVPSHQPRAIAGAITELLQDPSRICQMGASARARAMQDYSPRAWMEKLLHLYGQLLPAKVVG
jgi:glycosyltransferase involved in cell wall biosynthesis